MGEGAKTDKSDGGEKKHLREEKEKSQADERILEGKKFLPWMRRRKKKSFGIHHYED